MDWLNGDFVRSLSAPAVLLLFCLGVGWAAYRDRNARIREAREDRDARIAEIRADKDAQIDKLWATVQSSEQAREKQAEGLRSALEAGQSAVAAVDGLRRAVERIISEQRDEGMQ